MMRRVPVRMTWLLGALGVAIAVACKGGTAPHQPALCPSYSGGASQGDSLYGLYHLVSYCLDTLPAFTPPAGSGHVALIHATSVDSFVAVLVPQGQAPESILGTYTHPGLDSIHVTGEVRAPGLPFAPPGAGTRRGDRSGRARARTARGAHHARERRRRRCGQRGGAVAPAHRAGAP